MTRLTQHARSNVVAYLALFVALGGTGYAAINLPANSVGGKQILLDDPSGNPVELFEPGLPEARLSNPD